MPEAEPEKPLGVAQDDRQGGRAGGIIANGFEAANGPQGSSALAPCFFWMALTSGSNAC